MPEREAQVRAGRLGRESRLWVGPEEGRMRARPAGGPGPLAGRGRGLGWRGWLLGLFRGWGPQDVARAYGKGRRGRALR